MFFRYFYYFLKILFKKEFKNGKKHRVFRVGLKLLTIFKHTLGERRGFHAHCQSQGQH